MPAQYRKLGWLLWLVALTCCAEDQYGPSFDCQRATLEIEKWICNDPQLALADQIIHDSYRILLKQQTNPQALIAEQRAWLKARNNFRDEQKNKIFFEGRAFEQGGFRESEQVNNAFATRLYGLFHRLPKEQQQALREGYLRRMDIVTRQPKRWPRCSTWKNAITHGRTSQMSVIRKPKRSSAMITASQWWPGKATICVTGDPLFPQE